MGEGEGEVRSGSRRMKPIPGSAEAETSPSRAMLPILPGNVQPRGFSFYAVVLPGLSASTLYRFIAEHWLSLDELTGRHTVLLAPVIPQVVTAAYLAWWQPPRLTPDQYAALQVKLLAGLEPGAYDAAVIEAYQLATSLGIQASELPAIVVTASPQGEPQEDTRSPDDILIPLDRTWDEGTIGKFFELFAEVCERASSVDDPEARLMILHDDVQNVLAACAPAPVTVSVAPQPLGIRVLAKGAWTLASAILPLIVKTVLMH